MADAGTRAREILRALPLSQKQRDLYERGVAAMDEATLERTTSKLESALSTVPNTVAAARKLLASQLAQSRPRVVVVIEDAEYRHVLASMLGQELEVETTDAPEEAIQMIGRAVPDIVICDFKMPRMHGVDLIREMRRVASAPSAIFIRTTNPEEDGQVAAVGASGYPASNTAMELTRAVTSAIEARGYSNSLVAVLGKRVAGITESAGRVKRQVCDAVVLMRKALDTMRPSAEARGIRLEMSVLDEKVVVVSIDPAEFQQVVLNLVSNALEFAPKGGVVHARVDSDGSNLFVKIQDTDMGIEGEAMPRIFDPFFATSAAHGKAASGLGLAVVKGIVEKHGGRITANSRGEGRGTVLQVTLPLVADRIELDRLGTENDNLREQIAHGFNEMVGNSPALLDALRKVEAVAQTDSTVLIVGESGTGKELFARAVHSRSGRSDRPLVTVNCAMPPQLIEAELFGSASTLLEIQKRVGLFELANSGTIFLDEIGELPLGAQAKLLQVLEERESEPVESDRPKRLSVRVIAATNRALAQAVHEGKFREDLFYRLNVFPIIVPPLRARKADIPLLVEFFSRNLARELSKTIQSFSARSMNRMVQYSWPGNVRELKNVVERAVIVAEGPIIDLDVSTLHHLDDVEDSATRTARISPGASMEDLERKHILRALEKSRGVVGGSGGAAVTLGLHPNTLRGLMKRLGISVTPEGTSRASEG